MGSAGAGKKMRATAIEFRFRMLIQIAIVFVGFWAPWIGAFDLGRRVSTLEWLALEISRTGLLSFTLATPVVIILGSLAAALGAVFRVWGSAYLGYATVHHGAMQAGSVMAAGPYRYVRNPLYIGGSFMMAAISMLMPPTGALFTLVLVAVFYLRLILGEEAFLTVQLGEPYREYLRAVPRLIPRLHSTLPRAAAQPHWLIAILTEINPIGIFFTLAVLSWRYDNLLMIKSILVSFGLSLVIRALMPREQSTPMTA
jgi:protein-S-isoprenylcysteine O-methyltransferase Ste14